MIRRPLFAAVAALALAAPAGTLAASNSTAELWSALGGSVNCGIAIHPVNSPPMRLLCSAVHIPPPKSHGSGDPGFVFLASTGHPSLARLSQDSFVGSHAVALAAGRTWGGTIGPVKVTCTIGASSVRCVNTSHHGFTITKHSYSAF